MENLVAGAGDEELSLFLEMRRREKAQGVSSLLQSANSVDKTNIKSSVLSATSCVQLRKSAVEKFLDTENNKSDYEWLLEAPDLLGEKEAQENSMVKLKDAKSRSNALKPRVENIPQEPVTWSVKTSKQIPRFNSSPIFSKQANTVTELKPRSKQPLRQATPTSRTTLPSTRQNNSTQNSNPASKTSSVKSNPRASAFHRSSSVGKSVPNTKSPSLSNPERNVRPRPVSTSRTSDHTSGDKSTGRSKISNDVNPVLMGSQMVERVVNMRKLPPPKQDDNISALASGEISLNRLLIWP